MLKREKKVVQVQLEQMECGGGVSFWPKPILHFASTLKFDSCGFIVVIPCGLIKDTIVTMLLFHVSTPIILFV